MKKFLSIVSIFLFIINYSQIRDDITYLNGEWEIIYDYDNIGKLEAYNTDEGFSKGKIEKITVPSVWERFKKDYEGVVYYRTSFKVDNDYKDKKIHLNFNASNYITEVFLNNNSVGFHEGGFSPFSFNVEHIINYDSQNVLIVKVMGPITIQDKIIDGIGQMETPQWRGSYTGGIWQDVFLSYTGQTHINDVFITGNFRNGDIEIINEINNGIGDGLYKLILPIRIRLLLNLTESKKLLGLENLLLKTINFISMINHYT